MEHGDRASSEVALTFTVGYRLDPAVEILELLREREVASTIFISGVVFDQDKTRAAAERVLQIIAERPDLFQLGQHGYSAAELPGLPIGEAIEEVLGAERTLARNGVPDVKPYFSPPGGAQNPEVLKMLGSLGYSTTLLWDVDPLDWKPPADGGPSAGEVAARVLDHVKGGSIVLAAPRRLEYPHGAARDHRRPRRPRPATGDGGRAPGRAVTVGLAVHYQAGRHLHEPGIAFDGRVDRR